MTLHFYWTCLETLKRPSYWYPRWFLSGVYSVSNMEGWTPGKNRPISLQMLSHGWVVTFPDSHRSVLTFRNWSDLLDVVLAFWISILNISKLVQNCWHIVIHITNFEKTFGKFFRPHSEILSKFGDISFQEYVWKGISHPVFYGDLVYKLRRVKDTPNFISPGSKIVKRLRRRQYDLLITKRTIGLVFGPSTALYRPFLKHCTLNNKVDTVKTSSEASGSWSSSPLIFSRDSFSHHTWARFQTGGA